MHFQSDKVSGIGTERYVQLIHDTKSLPSFTPTSKLRFIAIHSHSGVFSAKYKLSIVLRFG